MAEQAGGLGGTEESPVQAEVEQRPKVEYGRVGDGRGTGVERDLEREGPEEAAAEAAAAAAEAMEKAQQPKAKPKLFCTTWTKMLSALWVLKSYNKLYNNVDIRAQTAEEAEEEALNNALAAAEEVLEGLHGAATAEEEEAAIQHSVVLPVDPQVILQAVP